MKHLLIYSDCAGQYGAEQVNHSLALALHSAGYRVTFAQPRADHALVREREAVGIAHHWLPEEQLYELQSPAASLRDSGPASTIFKQSNPDLVLFADGCPFSSLAAKEWCATHHIGFLVLVHCVVAEWQQDFAVHTATLARCYQAAREVIAVSTDNLHLLRQLFGLASAKGRVIYNGRPAVFFGPPDAGQRMHVREALGVGESSILCLSIGRMEPVKGYQFQLEAMSKLVRSACRESLHFVWVGAGTQQQRLLRVARLLAGRRFTHLEMYTDMPLLLGASDMLLHTARFEGMPLVVLEAMASGLPVVSTGVSGIPEALADTGVLLQPPHLATDLPQEIADAVCSLAADAPRRARLGQAAKLRAQALFGEERMVQQYLVLIAETMARVSDV
ncbi:MAG: glycosyltransferase family 4 protein [Halioglobus sp.]